MDDGRGRLPELPADARAEYEAFYDALVAAESATVHDFDKEKFFEGCLPIEVMAHRGADTLRFGPMKPVGPARPAHGPLRPMPSCSCARTTLAGDHFSLVGFQTQLKWGEQARVLKMIPGLEQAEFVRFGMVHRNTCINGPTVLRADVADVARDLTCCSPARCPVSRATSSRRRRGSSRACNAGGGGARRSRAAPPRDDGHRRAGALRVARRPAPLPAEQHHQQYVNET